MPLSIRDARGIWSAAMEVEGFDRIAEDYPEAALRFRELDNLNQLPSLKMKLSYIQLRLETNLYRHE